MANLADSLRSQPGGMRQRERAESDYVRAAAV
jgi:hypothetical protein